MVLKFLHIYDVTKIYFMRLVYTVPPSQHMDPTCEEALHNTSNKLLYSI